MWRIGLIGSPVNGFKLVLLRQKAWLMLMPLQAAAIDWIAVGFSKVKFVLE